MGKASPVFATRAVIGRCYDAKGEAEMPGVYGPPYHMFLEA
jgi:hypothetical protein